MTFVLCAKPWRISTAWATRQWPRTSPPVTTDTFDPAWLSGARLVYVCLHGLQNTPYWYGSGSARDVRTWVTAVTADQIRKAEIPGAIVYLAGCWGQSPMSDALFDAGAACVVGDRDSNSSGVLWPTGSNRFGQLFVAGLHRGFSANQAFEYARRVYARGGRGHSSLLETVDLLGDGLARLV